MENFLYLVLTTILGAKSSPKIPNCCRLTVLFLKLPNQPNPKHYIKTPHSSFPKLPKKRNFNKIWKFMSSKKHFITTCLNNLLPQKPISNALNFSRKNQISFQLNKICACSIKNHWKSFAYTIFKKFARNVQFLGNTKAMILRVQSSLKRININFAKNQDQCLRLKMYL